MTAVIKASDVCVEFPISKVDQRREVEKGRSSPHKASHVAVRDFNCLWSTGDRIGIRGPNGAGKTTLLKMLAGVYVPTKGALEVTGKVVSLTDLYMGFDSSANAFQNIQLRGRLLGASPEYIDSVLSSICEFSELGDFLFLPLRTYSSGMLMRLAFSVTAFMPFDVLLMDEWLSVGDAAFNVKVETRLKEMVDAAKIFVLASHAISQLDRVCQRQYEIVDGTLVEIRATHLNESQVIE